MTLLLRDHLDQEYGKEATKSKNEHEVGFESFKSGVLLQDLRTQEGLTQEVLAIRCATTKSYISRIENNVSDIRLSTIIRIFREGFGKQIKLCKLNNTSKKCFTTFLFITKNRIQNHKPCI